MMIGHLFLRLLKLTMKIEIKMGTTSNLSHRQKMLANT
jgi:hypothetical protein